MVKLEIAGFISEEMPNQNKDRYGAVLVFFCYILLIAELVQQRLDLNRLPKPPTLLLIILNGIFTSSHHPKMIRCDPLRLPKFAYKIRAL